MKLHARILFGCVTIHLVHGGLAENDDFVAMLQGSFGVKQQGEDTNYNHNGNAAVPDMDTVSRLEEMVMANVREGKLIGDNNLTGVINASVKKMYTTILAATNANQQLIIENIKAFKKCKISMWKTYDRTIPVERDHWIMSTIYPKCIKAENLLAQDNGKNKKIVKTVTNTLKAARKLAQIEEKKCVNTCGSGNLENYHEQLQRLAKYYTKCKKSIGPHVAKVAKLSKQLKRYVAGFKLSNAKYEAMKKKCKKIAYIMNQYKCRAVTNLDTSCTGYEACWKRALRVYLKNKAAIEKEEKDMKVQWRALHRIQCFLKVTNKNDKNDKKQLQTCINIKRKDISTKALDIDYKKIPKKPKCPKDPMCPCTKFYTNSYFKVGPKKNCVNNIVKKYVCPICAKKRRR